MADQLTYAIRGDRLAATIEIVNRETFTLLGPKPLLYLQCHFRVWRDEHTVSTPTVAWPMTTFLAVRPAWRAAVLKDLWQALVAVSDIKGEQPVVQPRMTDWTLVLDEIERVAGAQIERTTERAA
jgi:hypothetical protein